MALLYLFFVLINLKVGNLRVCCRFVFIVIIEELGFGCLRGIDLFLRCMLVRLTGFLTFR